MTKITTNGQSLVHNGTGLDGKKRQLCSPLSEEEPDTGASGNKMKELFPSGEINNYAEIRSIIDPGKMGGYYYKNQKFINKHIKNEEIHCIDMSSAYLGALKGGQPDGDLIMGDTNKPNVLKLLKIRCKFKPNGKKQIKKLYYISAMDRILLKDGNITSGFNDELKHYDDVYLTNGEYDYLKDGYDFEIAKIECIGYFNLVYGMYDKVADKLYIDKKLKITNKVFSLIMIGQLGHKNTNRERGYKPYTPINIAITAKTRIKQWMKSDEIIRDGGQITHMVLDSVYWIKGHHDMSQYKEKKLGEYSLALPEGCDEMIMFSSQGYAIKRKGELMKVAHGFLHNKSMNICQERVIKSIMYNLPFNEGDGLKKYITGFPLDLAKIMNGAFYV